LVNRAKAAAYTSAAARERSSSDWAAQLLADAEFLNDVFVTLGVVLLEVVEQATPLADQHEKAAAGAMVLLVGLEVLRKLTDALAQDRDLHFGAARVAVMDTILLDNALFVISR
jgi:hypothetical protein